MDHEGRVFSEPSDDGYRCPECGYTRDDAAFYLDHHLCEARGGPKMPPWPKHNTDLVDAPPERVWIVGQQNLVGFSTRFFASNLDHGDEYPEYVRADLYEQAVKERAEAEKICRGWEDRFHELSKRLRESKTA